MPEEGIGSDDGSNGRASAAARKEAREGLAAFKNAVRGASPQRPVVPRVRHLLPPSAYRAAVAWLWENPHLQKLAMPPAFPQKIQAIGATRAWKGASAASEIQWAGIFLRRFSDELASFVSLSRHFGTAFLGGRFDECASACHEIEIAHGQSLWLIKKRILLLQATLGLAAQKQFVSELRQADRRGGIAAWVGYYVSIRNEPLVSLPNFLDQVDRALRDVPPDMDAFLRRHVAPTHNLTERAIADILRHEAVCSVVDLYETLLYVSRCALARGHVRLKPSIRSAVRSLSRVGDARTVTILSVGCDDDTAAVAVNQDSQRIFEFFTAGDPQRALDTFRALTPSAVDFDALEGAARAMATLSLSSPDAALLLERLVGLMASVARKDPPASSHVAELRRIAMNSHGDDWAEALWGFLELEFREPGDVSDECTYAALSVSSRHPQRLQYLLNPNALRRYASLALPVLDGGMAKVALAIALGAPSPTAPVTQETALLEAAVAILSAAIIADGKKASFGHAFRWSGGVVHRPS